MTLHHPYLPPHPRRPRPGGGAGAAGRKSNLAVGMADPLSSPVAFGFRVASIPEPSAALLLIAASGAWLLRRRRRVLNAALVLGLGLTMTATNLRADTFGSGTNAFTIDFVAVGNPGNADDSGTTGVYSTPYGGVSYSFRIATCEVPEGAIAGANALGGLGITKDTRSQDRPATRISWYEAAAFVNWLNTSTGHQGAYNLTFGGIWSMALWSSAQAWQAGGENLFRHKDAYYFLPSEDEWYKAAYYSGSGTTYYDYPTAGDTVPDGIDFAGDPTFDAVFMDNVDQGTPNPVTDAGVLGPYGTMGQGGNVWEWTESPYDGVFSSGTVGRALRGGGWSYWEHNLRATYRGNYLPGTDTNSLIGFRVASVPEPSAALLLIAAGGAWPLTRRRSR